MRRSPRSAAALAALALIAATPASAQSPDLAKGSAPKLQEAYGPDAALQYGELRLPPGKGPFPVAIFIHGGCWTKGFATAKQNIAFVDALTEAGFATWNVEYRQLGEPGAGWPGTFQDWAAAADHLRAVAKTQPLDLKRVIAVGHSAGALGAYWLAARAKLPAASEVRGARPLPLRAVVDIDGPMDIAPFIGRDRLVCGAPVISRLMGGLPAEQPAHYAEGSPVAHLPLGVRQLLISSQVMTPADTAAHKAAAAAKGDTVAVLDITGGDHFDVVTPSTAHGREVVAFIKAQALR